MATVPGDTPSNMPEDTPIVATDGSPDVQEPPVVVDEYEAVNNGQTVAGPEIPAGVGLTVTVADAGDAAVEQFRMSDTVRVYIPDAPNVTGAITGFAMVLVNPPGPDHK